MESLDAFNDDPNHLKGIGGWLILVAIGVTLSPFILVADAYSTYKDLFSIGSFELLTDPSSPSYIPHFGALIYGEIIINGLFILLGLVLIYLFYSQHHHFPLLYMILAIATPTFLLVDAWAAAKVLPQMEMFDEETTRLLTRSIITVAIWVPYMLVSERVKQTFVRPSQPNQHTSEEITFK
ncbi:DUF2569 domain-containing protein [Kangiella shandongensis]|uniref:DUF2569 domain-containing protein n=1 Tax=Kangiella shandongensis TaxID=2763258 RepID=UPI001CBB020F|nr:DUF2569 domain-containing protein [Kangiella shandongensis]